MKQICLPKVNWWYFQTDVTCPVDKQISVCELFAEILFQCLTSKPIQLVLNTSLGHLQTHYLLPQLFIPCLTLLENSEFKPQRGSGSTFLLHNTSLHSSRKQYLTLVTWVHQLYVKCIPCLTFISESPLGELPWWWHIAGNQALRMCTASYLYHSSPVVIASKN